MPGLQYNRMANGTDGLIALAVLASALLQGVAGYSPGRAIIPPRWRLGGGKCESAVHESFKRGLASGGIDDVLKRARELDGKSGAGLQLALMGTPVFSAVVGTTSGPEASTESILLEEGALIFRELLVQGDRGLMNPRDEQYLISDEVFDSSTQACEAVAFSRVQLALMPSSAMKFFATPVCWTGLVGLRLAAGAGTIIGGQLVDVVRVRELLALKRSPLERDRGAGRGREEGGISSVKVAWIEHSPLIEPSVACAIDVAMEMLVRAGAEVKQVRLKTAADLEALQNDGFSALVSPGSPTAALPAAVHTSKTTTTLTEPWTTALLDNLSITLPCGVVAGEDDGYDSSMNEEKDREGLPINLCITSLSRAAQDEDVIIRVATKYEAMTRWASSVHPVGATRLEAAADMDDAREAFGIYFVKSLLLYLGKRQPV